MTASTHPPRPPRLPLHFVRHGATAANLAGLRCGGDLDLPLTEQGRAQAEAAAEQIARLQPAVGVIVTSDLQRTRDTAALIARRLPGASVVVDAGFGERWLGQWNLQPMAQSQAALEARLTPPGGESDEAFTARIRAALVRIAPWLPRQVLLVGSKGVARVLAELSGQPGRLDLDNGVVTTFDGARLTRREALESTA